MKKFYLIQPEDAVSPRVAAIMSRVVGAIQPKSNDPPGREPLSDHVYAMLALTSTLAALLIQIEQKNPGAGRVALGATKICLDEYYAGEERRL